MTAGMAALTRSDPRHIREASASGLGAGAIQAFAIALALSGLTELLLQRVVYRVGVHIPREGAYFESYRAATFAGDFAFRLTAVLLTVTTAMLVVHLFRSRQTAVTGVVVGVLLVGNLLVWPLAAPLDPGFVALGVAAAAAWIAGSALGARAGVAVLAGAVAVVLSQFWAGMSLLGHEPAGLASMHLVSELAIICAALLAAALAFGRRSALRPALGAAALSLLLAATYVREPSTFAIVSLWAIGVTVSLPPAAYLAAFCAAAFAFLSWVRKPATRPMAIGLVLLLVAGLQPQALHHGVTALVGLILLGTGPAPSPDRLNVEASDDV